MVKAIKLDGNEIVNIEILDSIIYPYIEYIAGANIGDFVIDGFLVPKILAIEVPQSVTPRQARLALLQATLLDEVELLLANDKAMQIWWEYSLDIQRNHPHIITMGTALGLSEQQLDELFILGATL